MRNKKKTIIDVLSESGRKILAEVKAETRGDLLLDLVPPDGSGSAASESECIGLGARSNIKEIDYSRTSDDMILEGKAILKTVRRCIG